MDVYNAKTAMLPGDKDPFLVSHMPTNKLSNNLIGQPQTDGATANSGRQNDSSTPYKVEPVTQTMNHVDLGKSGGRTKQPRNCTFDKRGVAVPRKERTGSRGSKSNPCGGPGEVEVSGVCKGNDSWVPGGKHEVSYNAERIIGSGSFGVVFQATVVGSDEVVAIKKVLQDKRFKNRELQIMRMLAKNTHPNLVTLRHSFCTTGDNAKEVYFNLVLEYMPETVYGFVRRLQKIKQPLLQTYVKLYIWQLARALAHIHALNICHRDIKPQNLLLDPSNHVLKLCDFGSAKVLTKGEPNVSYICSRYYRAPELIFGSTDYTCAIDTWSLGCVAAELMLGEPLFPGDSGVDQLVEIIKVLGTPSRLEIQAMNHSYTEFKFPQVEAHPWSEIFPSWTSQEAMDLISSILRYDPEARMLPLTICLHPFLDDIWKPDTRLPDGSHLPPVHNFTDLELQAEPRIMNYWLIPYKGNDNSKSDNIEKN